MSTAGEREVAVFEGGPWGGWWLTRERLEINQRASEHTGSPTALGYVETDRWKRNPEEFSDGRVWVWQPSSRAGVICRLCGPRATASTETYCDRCS